jgi:FHA domain/DUF1707 SHOCT-like domain
VPDRRASQRDRESAIERLKPRLVDGSLSTDTFSARVESAYAARTKGELRELLADLPGVRARLAEVGRRARAWLAGPVGGPSAPELRLPETTQPVELSIGRADYCDLILDEATVSRQHAMLRRTPEGWELRDLGSTNGTRVNGWRIERAPLRAGDELMLGLSRFVVRG